MPTRSPCLKYILVDRVPEPKNLKLDDQMIERLVSAVEGGLSYRRAAPACGVTERSLRTWRARGEAEPSDSNSIYRQLYDSLEAARSEMAKTLLADWLEMARGHKSWRGVQAYLAVTMPEEFGEIRRTQVDVREGSKVDRDPGSGETADSLRERWRVLFPNEDDSGVTVQPAEAD